MRQRGKKGGDIREGPTKIRGCEIALETTQGQIDSFFSQLPFKCYLPEVASVADSLKICPWVASRVVQGCEIDLGTLECCRRFLGCLPRRLQDVACSMPRRRKNNQAGAVAWRCLLVGEDIARARLRARATSAGWDLAPWCLAESLSGSSGSSSSSRGCS